MQCLLVGTFQQQTCSVLCRFIYFLFIYFGITSFVPCKFVQLIEKKKKKKKKNSFATTLQKELDDIVEHWNTHRIRKSRRNTISGRPDSIFYLPEQFGGTDMKLIVPERQISDVVQDVVINEEGNEYTDYFEYVRSHLSLEMPTSWETSLELFQKIMRISQTGYL